MNAIAHNYSSCMQSIDYNCRSWITSLIHYSWDVFAFNCVQPLISCSFNCIQPLISYGFNCLQSLISGGFNCIQPLISSGFICIQPVVSCGSNCPQYTFALHFNRLTLEQLSRQALLQLPTTHTKLHGLEYYLKSTRHTQAILSTQMVNSK